MLTKEQKELAEVIEKYFGADAAYLDIDCFTLARRILEAGWEKPVLCKDCKHQIKAWHPDNRMISKGYYTYGCNRNFHLYSSNAVNGHDNEFCSNGERRERENDSKRIV